MPLNSAPVTELPLTQRLHCPFGGVVPHMVAIRPEEAVGDPVTLFCASSADIAALYPDRPTMRDAGGRCVVHGAGCDTNAELAALKAGMEVFERYAAVVHWPGSVLTGTPEALGSSAIRLETDLWAGSESSQLAERTDAEDKANVLRWTMVRSLCGRKSAQIPLALLKLGLAPIDGEQPIVQTSIGLAAHESRERAVESAVYEVLERDALEAFRVLAIPATRLPPELRRERGSINAGEGPADPLGVETSLYRLQMDHTIPIVVCVKLFESTACRFCVVGTSAHHDIAIAARKAHLEAAGLMASKLDGHGSPELSVDPESLSREARPPDGRAETAPSPSPDFEQLMAEIEDDIFVYELTCAEGTALGIETVRVLIPGLLWSRNRHARHPTNARRVARLKRVLGVSERS